jgi:ribosome maturation factor RimP
MRNDATELADNVTRAARPILAAMGLTLWGVEIAGGAGKPVVRIYIEREGGATIDDCAKASRQIDVALEAEEAVHGAYILEVSTPGIERPFFSLEQMRPHVGEKVAVHLGEHIEGRKKYTGALVSVDDDAVTVEAEDGTFELAHDDVKRARLVVDDPVKATRK